MKFTGGAARLGPCRYEGGIDVAEGIEIDFEEAEASLFQDPGVEPSLPGMFGVLYLLRRDLKQCMTEGPEASFPAVMLVMAGIDLLGKFYAGSDGPRSSGKRFKRFVADFMSPRSEGETDAVYQLRNALMHSFGLYSKKLDAKGKIVQEWRFGFHTGPSPTGEMVSSQGDSKYLFSITTLYRRFEAAVAAYRARLATKPELQESFRAMFGDYGTTGVGRADRPMTVGELEDQIRQS